MLSTHMPLSGSHPHILLVPGVTEAGLQMVGCDLMESGD